MNWERGTEVHKERTIQNIIEKLKHSKENTCKDHKVAET